MHVCIAQWCCICGKIQHSSYSHDEKKWFARCVAQQVRRSSAFSINEFTENLLVSTISKKKNEPHVYILEKRDFLFAYVFRTAF